MKDRQTIGRRPRRHATAFTLIELLVVVAIIAVLASLLLPALSKAKDTATQVACTTRLRQLYVAYNGYTDENDSHIPYGATIGTTTGHYYNATGHCGGGYNLSWYDLLYPYLDTWAAYNCPTRKPTANRFSYIGSCFIFVEVWQTTCCVPGCSTHVPGYITYDQRDLTVSKVGAPDRKVLFYDASHYAVGGYNGQIGYWHRRGMRANFMYFTGQTGSHSRDCAWAYPRDPAQTHYFASGDNPTACICPQRGWR